MVLAPVAAGMPASRNTKATQRSDAKALLPAAKASKWLERSIPTIESISCKHRCSERDAADHSIIHFDRMIQWGVFSTALCEACFLYSGSEMRGETKQRALRRMKETVRRLVNPELGAESRWGGYDRNQRVTEPDCARLPLLRQTDRNPACRA
jgi:hypothetical protein